MTEPITGYDDWKLTSPFDSSLYQEAERMFHANDKRCCEAEQELESVLDLCCLEPVDGMTLECESACYIRMSCEGSVKLVLGKLPVDDPLEALEKLLAFLAYRVGQERIARDARKARVVK